MDDRLDNVQEVKESDIATRISSGNDVVIQFSKASYPKALLETIDSLCRRFGERLQVRFYGHYGETFDCKVLRDIPSVVSLAVDCLMRAENIEALYELRHLRSLSIGIYELDAPQLLYSENLKHLRVLTLGGSRRNTVDLSPLSSFVDLTRLHITGYAKHIDALGESKRLETLSLSGIKHSIRLGFASRIKGLQHLVLILGGRSDISEVAHTTLRKLEVIRVRGFAQFSAESLPNLEYLRIEDQIKLEELDLKHASPSLERIWLVNCKTLKSLKGLSGLGKLNELRISRTALDFDKILNDGLPPSLKVFGFYAAKAALTREIRTRLAKMGLKEFQ